MLLPFVVHLTTAADLSFIPAPNLSQCINVRTYTLRTLKRMMDAVKPFVPGSVQCSEQCPLLYHVS